MFLGTLLSTELIVFPGVSQQTGMRKTNVGRTSDKTSAKTSEHEFASVRYTNDTIVQFLNPLHPNISMYILHTVPYSFLKVLTRGICLKIKSFFSW